MKKNNTYRSHSRRKTPWDDLEDPTVLESFIRKKYKDHYNDHHDSLHETDEAALLNSYTPDSCRYCGSTRFRKNGFDRNGLQKYYCKDCSRNFTITTSTIFENHKLPVSEWIEYLLNLFGYSSLNLNSKTNKNSPTTSKYWLKKVFLLLEDYQSDIILKGKAYIDETYYTVIKSDIKTSKDGKKPRGLSSNKICIGIGCDRDQVYLTVEGRAKTSETKTLKAFKDHIGKRSTLIHDEEQSHNILVETLDLKSRSYNSAYLKTLDDKHNPLNRINRYCNLLKKFLNSHPGFDRDELQDYLNLFSFMMNAPYNKLEKVKILLDKALNSSKRITFRQYYSKKER